MLLTVTLLGCCHCHIEMGYSNPPPSPNLQLSHRATGRFQQSLHSHYPITMQWLCLVGDWWNWSFVLLCKWANSHIGSIVWQYPEHENTRLKNKVPCPSQLPVVDACHLDSSFHDLWSSPQHSSYPASKGYRIHCHPLDIHSLQGSLTLWYSNSVNKSRKINIQSYTIDNTVHKIWKKLTIIDPYSLPTNKWPINNSNPTWRSSLDMDENLQVQKPFSPLTYNVMTFK